jgi:hypothetical protein
MHSVNMQCLVIIHLFKSRFLVNLGVAAMEVFVRGRAATTVEEANVEAVTVEIISNGVDGGGGDRWSRER